MSAGTFDPWSEFTPAPPLRSAQGQAPGSASDPWGEFTPAPIAAPAADFAGVYGGGAMARDGGGNAALRAGLERQGEGIRASTPAAPSRLKSFGLGAAQGLTFDFVDEAAAGINAAIDALTGQAPNGIGAAYDARLASGRRQLQEAEQANPGSSLAGKVTGGVATGLALGGAGLLPSAGMGAATFVPRAAVAAAEGATLAGAYGFGKGEGGFENRAVSALQEAPLGAAFGVGAETALPIVGRVVGAVANRFRSPVAGDALEQARGTLAEQIGVNPATIPDDVAASFAREAERAVSPEAAARTTAADEFGIPLTRGQATGDMGQLAFEEAARREARGRLAGNQVRGFDERQAAAINTARTNIAEDLGGPVTTTSQNELAADILQGIRGAAARDRAGVDAAYGRARDAGTVVKSDAVQGARTRVRQRLQDDGFVINPTTSPYASAALDAIDDMAGFGGALANRTATGVAPQGSSIAGVSLAGIEKVRSQIGRLAQNATPEDARAVRAVQRAFDGWLDDAAERGLLEGSPEGIELFKAARQARRSYATKYEATGRDFDAGKVVERLLSQDVTPVEVANALMGAAKAGERGLSVRLAGRVQSILGKDSPEWGMLRQAMWHRLTNATADGLPVPGPEAVAKRVREFVSGKGEPYARILYTPAELGQMSRFAAAVEQTVTPRGIRNPSGSGYEAARAIAEGVKTVAGLIGGIKGGPAAAYGSRLAAGALGEARGFLRARQATSGAPVMRYGPGERGAVAGASAVSAEQTPGARVVEPLVGLGAFGMSFAGYGR